MVSKAEGDFGSRLRLEREQAGLSREQLAARVGLDVSHVFRLETGGRRPSRDAVLAFAEALRLNDEAANRWLVAAGYAPLPALAAVRGAVRARGAVRTRGKAETPGVWNASARARRLESVGLTESTIARLLDAMATAGLAEQEAAANAVSAAFARIAQTLESRIHTAVIPAAGGQHRLLAAHVMQRLIASAIGEAAQAGIRNVVLVLAPGSIEPLYSPLKEMLELAMVPAIRLLCCVQPSPEGLGQAILQAELLVEGAPFAVLLPDDVVRERAGRPIGRELRRMTSLWNDLELGSLIAVCSLPKMRLARGGAARLAAKPVQDNVFPIQQLAEKPQPSDPISNARNVFGIVGRYLLQPSVFAALRELARHGKRPLELTDALAAMLGGGAALHAYQIEARRRDIGAALDEARDLIGDDGPA